LKTAITSFQIATITTSATIVLIHPSLATDALLVLGELAAQLEHLLLEAGLGGDVERARAGSVDPRDRADPPGASREEHDAVGQEDRLGDRMRDEHDGRLRRLGEPLQLEVHLVARDRVERAEGLVHEQDLGVVAQGSSNGDALAHAARELPRERLLEALQADELAQLVRPAPALALVDLAQRQRQPDVLLDRVPGEEVRVLEDEAELAQRLVVAVIAAPQRAAADRHLAGARLRQAGQDPQQRRLPAARLPE
jgi:hypothetical protein